MLVLERCCLQKRRVNPIRSAFPELHSRSWVEGPREAYLGRAELFGLPASPPRPFALSPYLGRVAPEITKVQLRCLLFGNGDGRGRCTGWKWRT